MSNMVTPFSVIIKGTAKSQRDKSVVTYPFPPGRQHSTLNFMTFYD